eukprot:6198970-Pleurochrysis_carterae.AAC.1
MKSRMCSGHPDEMPGSGHWIFKNRQMAHTRKVAQRLARGLAAAYATNARTEKYRGGNANAVRQRLRRS